MQLRTVDRVTVDANSVVGGNRYGILLESDTTEIGITGTPVIDSANTVLYVVAQTKEVSGSVTNYVQRLHALDITTGAEKPNSPVVISASVPGTGAGSSGGMVSFDSAIHLQRSALLLVGGVVYIPWASSNCDGGPFHGWIIGYNAQTLQQVAAFNVSPNDRQGGIWMSGAGLAASPDGSIYCVTGNGTFDTSANPTAFGDSVLKLVQGSDLTVADYFTPHDQASMDSGDNDLGSGGAMVLPDFFYDIRFPVRAILEPYTIHVNWRWRMAARKMMERENVLSLEVVRGLFNKFFRRGHRFRRHRA